MKTNQFCKLLNLDRNTLRFYRDQKIITPTQSENGYFEYDRKDISSLLFALSSKRNRDITFPELSHEMNTTGSIEAIQAQIDHAESSLIEVEKQIAQLTKQKERLEYLINYRTVLLQSINTISEVKVATGLYYTSMDNLQSYDDIQQILAQGYYFYGLGFPSSKLEDDMIYPDFLFGVIERYGKLLPLTHMNYIDQGRALRYTVTINNLHELPTSIFDPVKAYCKDHDYTLMPYVTSTILDVHQNPEQYLVLFRFRIQ